MPKTLTIACSAESAKNLILPEQVAGCDLIVHVISHIDDIINRDICAIFIDVQLLAYGSLNVWVSKAYTLIVPLSLSQNTQSDNILVISDSACDVSLFNAINFCYQHQLLREYSIGLNRSLLSQGDDMEKLVDIGIALSAEKNLGSLLSNILTQGQRLVGCDAATLFLLDYSDTENPSLIFKLIQNQSLNSPFKEQRIPLTASSVVGHVALTGEVLNIEDAYTISEDVGYQFNRSFDELMNYRTVSLVAIPMVDQRKNTVGVLEFINHKKDVSLVLNDPKKIEQQVDGFSERNVSLLRALASQAAVAIENRQLLDDVNHLFDGFVQASVFAIEQRDPATSGHSFRVADLCGELALEVNANDSALRPVSFDENQMRELRFAALLHDFGKVGVREHVLVKAKKLPVAVIENIHYRIALEKQSIKNHALSEILQLIDSGGEINAVIRREIENKTAVECKKLDDYLTKILTSNEPTVLPDGDFSQLENIRDHIIHDCYGGHVGLLSEGEFDSLSVLMGSLTESERDEIESHVVHTANFLKLIPWTSELSRIPEIAGAHHEKLNGGGYPKGISAPEISFQSRIMTVCDIYDALTASDRPYKKAIGLQKAVDILGYEARAGFLDEDLVSLFVKKQCYKVLELKDYPMATVSSCSAYRHHVCDYDLHKNH